MKSQRQVMALYWGMCQWVFPLDLSDRATPISPARLLLVFLEVCTRGGQRDSQSFLSKWILPIVEGYLLWLFSTNTHFADVLSLRWKLAVSSFAILVQWLWKCLLWEAEAGFHQNFPFISWRKINWSWIVKTISVAYIWWARTWKSILIVLSVVWKQCLKPFYTLKPCHWTEKSSCCSLYVLWEG